MAIKIPDFVQHLHPYKAGKPIAELAREQGLTHIVKLASNENPLGPSPRALDAIQKALGQLHRYPDPKAYDLIHTLAKTYQKPKEELIAASGSDALIAYAINALTEEKDEILTSQGTFIGLYVNVHKLNRRLKCVGLKNYAYDLPALLSEIGQDTKIIYLANPNNPTGTFFTRAELENFLTKVPSHILVILDEAYAVYATTHRDYPNGLTLTHPNLLVLRTLSKSYGLAGLRIGFAWGPAPIIQAMYRVKLPFEPSVLAQAAVGAALSDKDFLAKTLDTNQRNLEKLADTLNRLHIPYPPTGANFLMMVFPTEGAAEQFTESCLREGLIVRHVKAFGIPNGVRINSGTDEETTFACQVIQKVYQHLKNKEPV